MSHLKERAEEIASEIGYSSLGDEICSLLLGRSLWTGSDAELKCVAALRGFGVTPAKAKKVSIAALLSLVATYFSFAGCSLGYG